MRVTSAPTTSAVVDGTHTLSDEHARLNRDVVRRTAPVLALLETRIWPHAELGTLVTYLRSAVLRQVADEEVYLFPHGPSAPPFAELSADHVRLHTLTRKLEAAYAEPCSPAELHMTIAELLGTLRRHLDEEYQVLTALGAADGEIPGAADLAATDARWQPAAPAPVVLDLDALPERDAVELCVERVLRLHAGDRAELHATDERMLDAVQQWLRDFDADRFGFESRTSGHGQTLRLSARHAATTAAVGYPG